MRFRLVVPGTCWRDLGRQVAQATASRCRTEGERANTVRRRRTARHRSALLAAVARRGAQQPPGAGAGPRPGTFPVGWRSWLSRSRRGNSAAVPRCAFAVVGASDRPVQAVAGYRPVDTGGRDPEIVLDGMDGLPGQRPVLAVDAEQGRAPQG